MLYYPFIYNSKGCFAHPLLLARQTDLVLKVAVSCKWKMAKFVASYSQKRLTLALVKVSTMF